MKVKTENILEFPNGWAVCRTHLNGDTLNIYIDCPCRFSKHRDNDYCKHQRIPHEVKVAFNLLG